MKTSKFKIMTYATIDGVVEWAVLLDKKYNEVEKIKEALYEALSGELTILYKIKGKGYLLDYYLEMDKSKREHEHYFCKVIDWYYDNDLKWLNVIIEPYFKIHNKEI